MEPAHLHFGGGATETILNPIVAVVLLVAIAWILASPRDKGITPFLLACFSIPVDQVVVLGGLHFTVLRILIIAGLIARARLAPSSSAGKFPGGFNGVDRMVVLWAISLETILSIQWMDPQAFIHNLGDFLDIFGGYLVVRFFIPDSAAVRRTVKTLAIICVIQGAFMVNEQISRINVFNVLGGIPSGVVVRDGKIRSAGVIGAGYAGALAGASIPLFLWLWMERKSRLIAGAALVGAMAMVFTSNSSTSVGALIASFVGLGFWLLRKRMRLVRWGLWLTLLGLHLVMKAPVWALVARIDFTGSSTNYFRYVLIDMTIRHFSDWWLLGAKDYASWAWGTWDLSDQFVAQAVTGGLLTLVVYIAIFCRSFGAIGKARKRVEGELGREWLFWCLGAGLFSIVISHFGINYPALMEISLFVFWACISTASFETMRLAEATNETSPDRLVAPDLVGAWVSSRDHDEQ